jgi:hypothetical protein
MRKIWMAPALAAAALALSVPAFAAEPEIVMTHPQALPPPVDDSGEVVPTVAPGDEIAIACQALEYTKPDSDVRVVLTISATPGETGTGYNAVMATDEQILKGAVRVKIPDAPDLQNHTVNLDVYVVTPASNKSCDAGHIKVVEK